MHRHRKPPVRDVVFIGGGHTNALALRMLGMDPIPGVRLTLISNVSHTPYSGMLPGYIAGLYDYDQAHIDLRKLCTFAQAQFVLGEVTGIDLSKHSVFIRDHPNVSFDLASVNIGSTPQKAHIPGVDEFALPVKPVPEFLARWKELVSAHEQHSIDTLTVVGGGAGGVELALAARTRLGRDTKIQIVHRNAEILDAHTPKVRYLLKRILEKRAISLYCGEEVTAIGKTDVRCKSGLSLQSTRTLWVTHAAPAAWLKQSGLTCTEDGFIAVRPTLQSTDCDELFAVGDVATQLDAPRPKSGVFAVRQAEPLVKNIRRYLERKRLTKYRPQRVFLSLISTGDRRAVASRGDFALSSRSMWWLKDWIDRRFVRRLQKLPHPRQHRETNPKSFQQEALYLDVNSRVRCRGCGSKLSGQILEPVLSKFTAPVTGDPIVTVSDERLHTDAAVLKIAAGSQVVQSVEVLPNFLGNPFILGKVAVVHAMSDLFAMGAEPHSAQLSIGLPVMSEILASRTLEQVLLGATKILSEMDAKLIGGHTYFTEELLVGVTANGLAQNHLLTKDGAKPGDTLILTKPLGIGLLFAGQMVGLARGRWIDEAVRSMLQPNQAAARIAVKYGASALTDMTGFGLAGHLSEMVRIAQLSTEITVEKIPILPGAAELLQRGLRSSLHTGNKRYSALKEPSRKDTIPFEILFDPQTSGGLLMTIPPKNSEEALEELRRTGHSSAKAIGTVLEKSDTPEIILK